MSIYSYTYTVQKQQLEKSDLILKECVSTLNSLLKIHDGIEVEEGQHSEEKQDLLRAMFVFCAGGLDALIKQAIKDALRDLIEVNQGAHNIFMEFAEKDIQNSKRADASVLNSKLITQLLIASNPKEELKSRLIYDLTSSSLQSKDQILKIASYFDVPSNAIVNDFTKLHSIFLERNKIIHEMDINFSGDRSRNPRDKDIVIDSINCLLEIADKFIREVDSRLSPVA
jgi:hypothetical protein